MNTGYRCSCGNRQTYAKIQKNPFNKNELEVEIHCSKCHNSVSTTIDLLTDDDWDFSINPLT